MSAKTTVRLCTMGQMAAVVPLLAGYELAGSGSVVVLALGLPGADPRQVGLLQRLDLPSDVDGAVAAAVALMETVTRRGATRAVAIAYPGPGQDPAPVLDALAVLGIDAHDMAVCEPGRVRGHGCTDRECLTWAPLPAVPAGFPPRVLAASRQALADSLQAGPGAVAVAEACDNEPAPAARQTCGSWAQIADVRGQDVAELPMSVIGAAVAGLATDVHIRDMVAAWLCPGTLPTQALDPVAAAVGAAILHTPSWGSSDTDGTALTERLLCVCSRVPQRRQSAAALTVLASGLWYQGEGTGARVVVERALAVAPDYRLALLLAQMLRLGIRPVGK